MNERTLLGIDCNGTEIYGQLNKISVHTSIYPNYDESSHGWLEGCSKQVCWSDESGSRFTKKDADELANKWNERLRPRDYARRDGTFEKGFDYFYGLRITNEKERSKWMDERMEKGFSFLYLKNEKRENVGVFCVETEEKFNYVFEGAKNTDQAPLEEL